MSSVIGGITQINLLNVNDLFVRGKEVDFAGTSAFLQAEIDAIELQIQTINNTVTRIDFNTPPALVGNLVITEDNKNSVLLTAIQNINTQIASLNKLDLTALPASPPGACIITPTTTNQALKALIDTNTGNITTLQGQVTTIQGQITTIQGQITTINGQITTINGQITAINAKLAHFSTFNYGADVMSGIADGTGFAAAVSGGAQNGNGVFVYPNTTTQTNQIVLTTAYDKNILIQGGNQVGIYGGADGTMLNVNVVDIGTKNDKINIGANHDLTNYPKIQIGVDNSLISGLASDLNLRGDIRLSSFNSLLPENAPIYTPVVIVDTSATTSNGNINKTTSDPTFSGLDVVGIGLAPITLNALTGVIAITALAGGVTVSTGLGACAFQCGAGGFSIATGAGLLNMATGAGNIEMSTLSGNITVGAGKGTGGSAGNTILNALQNVILQPDTATEIYKCSFVELNDNATAPPVTANRLYQQADALYWNGQLVQGGAGNQYVLKAGDTMTGALTLPEGITSILTLNNLTSAPTPVTNRLYLLNNVLTFNGNAISGPGVSFVLKTGDTMTGGLVINYDAGQTVPQLQLTNTNNAAPVGSQGAAINLRNDSVGNGSVGERCGKIDFSGKDSVGGGGRTYAAIQGYINDPTTTAIDGRLSSFVASNNTLSEMFRLVSTSTAVRQANIGATNTTIGPTAIGSTSTETLRVQGTAAIQTSLDVPLIQNAPAIYSATSTTLVDGAVKRYRPERQFNITDYPNPLTAPAIEGEKCIVLNAGGNPSSQVDSILQASDFPAISGYNLAKIVNVRAIPKTNGTPAMNVITTLYNEPNQQGHMFIQADIPGQPLTLSRIADFYFATAGQALVSDFVVTNFQNFTRIYVTGQFDTVAVIGTPLSINTANNFSGQIIVQWSGAIISNVYIQNSMPSNSTTQDASPFNNIQGFQGSTHCLIDLTGYSGIPQPANPPNDKYDTLVIGGVFNGIGTPFSPVTRPLANIAYYDWNTASSGGPIGWRAFQDTNWASPEGPNGFIAGGKAVGANGAMIFAFNGNLVGGVTSNFMFGLTYTAGQAAQWSVINGDASAINNVSNFYWDMQLGRNCVTGGNPGYPFGANNAVTYTEVYLNCGTDSGTAIPGVNFRPTSSDPYEQTDSLVVASDYSLPTYQLRPQFSSAFCFSVYRDNNYYPGVFFVARGNQLQTATLPFGPGAPNYDVIQLSPPAPIPCTSFGGYSTEVGYVGAVFGTDTNAYVYKLTSTGELVIELSGCVVRTYNDTNPAAPIVASNKLTFPLNTDGGSVVLCGDPSTSPASWWAISQDGPLYYDNTLIGGSGAGLNSVTASGAGITAVTTAGNVVIANTGVTSIVAGTGINVSGATGAVTISAASAPSGTIVLNLGKINIPNGNNSQPSVSSYIPMWDGTSAILKSGICTIGPNNFTLSIDGFNQYTYLTWNGANPITVNLKLDCSWYSTANQPYPTGADVEFTSTSAGNLAYAAVNFRVEIQELAAVIIQTMGTSLGSSDVIWQYSYGGTLTGTAFMKTGSYLRLAGSTNYQFNNSSLTPNTYYANLNFGGADQLVITAYESPYPV